MGREFAWLICFQEYIQRRECWYPLNNGNDDEDDNGKPQNKSEMKTIKSAQQEYSKQTKKPLKTHRKYPQDLDYQQQEYSKKEHSECFQKFENFQRIWRKYF